MLWLELKFLTNLWLDAPTAPLALLSDRPRALAVNRNARSAV
jgi:hypothetical protein